jgi:DNA-binding transcriptional LysR family regulator
MVVSASPAYLERRGVPQTPSDLMRHDCIAWSSVEPPNSWWFREGASDRTFPVRTRLSTSSADSAIGAAHAGLGLVQTTSYQAEPGLRDGRLALVLRAFECAPTPVSLVYVRRRLLPLKVRAFIDFAVPPPAIHRGDAGGFMTSAGRVRGRSVRAYDRVPSDIRS